MMRFFHSKKSFSCLLPVLLGALAAVLWWCFTPSPYAAVTGWETSPTLFDRNGNLFHVRLSSAEEYCIPVPIHAMGTWLPLLAVTIEDKRFYEHPGVDLLALGRAVGQNILRGKTVSGASTITSQLVRISIPRARTIPTKLIEFTQALQLERRLGKARILELYLNRAPLGGTFRGVEAAARGYFGKSAHQLTLAEAALLIGMFKGPTYYRPDLAPKRSLARRNEVLEEALKQGIVDRETVDRALQEPLPALKANLPMLAWHFAENVLNTVHLDAYYTGVAEQRLVETAAKGTTAVPFAGNSTKATAGAQPRKQLRWTARDLPRATTLHAQTQLLLEKTLRDGLGSFPSHVTAAGVVVSNATGEVLAYVGNSRFNPVEGTHWIDCGTAPRSPGSTLKPFIFGEAYAQGILLPLSLLADSPLSFSGKAPRNFDRHYRGPVSAQKALAFSLNAPAVRVLRMLRTENALHALHRYGFAHLTRDAGYYGDSLVLGGCETTLLELARAYTALANQGQLRELQMQPRFQATAYPPKHIRGNNDIIGYPVLPAAAYLAITSLEEPQAIPRQYADAFAKRSMHVATKTGTSYGLRDAWAVAATPEHTVMVWFGSPEGKPHENLVGGVSALPAALAIVQKLPLDHGLPWPKPQGLETYAACKLSGRAATPFCPVTRIAERIKDVSQTKPCNVHRPSADGIATVLPADLAEYAKQRSLTAESRRHIEIVSPRHRELYKVNMQAPTQKILLKAEGTTGNVYWFVNREFFAVQEEGMPLLWPMQPGDITISLVDDADKTAVTTFTVIDADERQPRVLQLAPAE